LDTTKLHLTDFSEDISPAREAKKIEITFQLPVEGTISQDFNEGIFPHRCHNGVDIAVPEGTLINATSDGWIVFNGWHQRYGNLLIIQHPNDYLSFYGHNQSILVEVGEKVRMGQPVAVSGNSGQSSAPHLHFEIRCRGKTIDPATLIPALKEENLNTDKTINPR
jgi:murein DD-endopeptidase MepM/ murein hydrolase activator NlpD